MTRLPDDQIDPYEPRLARRVDAFAEQAVRPFDAAAIATLAKAGARRRSLAGRLFGSAGSTARLGVVLAGALVGALALGVYIGAGGAGQTQSSNAPGPTPTTVTSALAPCVASDLSGHISAWDGAAGHRIATIIVRNEGKADCALPEYLRPALIDGSGRALMVGELRPEPAPIDLPAALTASSMVDMANYCGPAPAEGLTIRLYLPDDTSFELTSLGSLAYPLDPPPCNGAGAPASIEMQPLQRGGPAY
jgi:hypothetical protein